jgi:hypothetical protein
MTSSLMNAGDSWTDALIADLETLQNAAVDDATVAS